MKVILTRGIQASGKSFWAKQFILDNPTYRRVNRDEIRKMVNGYIFSDQNEKQVTVIERTIVRQFLFDGYNVIIDAMHLDKKYIETWKQFIQKLKDDFNFDIDEIEIKEFPISLNQAIERDKNRPDSLGEKILKKTWRKHELVLREMMETAKPKYEEDINLPHCLIVDIDGTLANSKGRRSMYDETKVGQDEVIPQVREVVNLFYDTQRLKVFIFSGRKDSCREQTEEWLRANTVRYNKVIMRKADDNRNDTIIKSEMFEEHIRGKYYCDFVIDDRHSVLEMWKNKGLFTFNVNSDPLAENKF